jgi:hypothetical protein
MLGKCIVFLMGMAALGLVPAYAATSYDTFNVDFFADDGAAYIPGAVFDVQTNVDVSTQGFTQNQFCPDDNWEQCICDPGVKLLVPDQPPPTPFDGSTTITIGSNGTFTQDYINVGPNITDFLFTTTDFSSDVTYTCSSDFFRFCGFEVTDGTPTLNILFADPKNPNGISSAAPEPKLAALLLIALGAATMVQRLRARRANG